MLTAGNILNPALISVLAGVGHGQLIVIADAGLPLPRDARVIDLSLVPGIPSFVDVLTTVLSHGAFEGYVAAEESDSGAVFDGVANLLNSLTCRFVDHETFKELLPTAYAIVRTGDCIPFANIALIAGTNF